MELLLECFLLLLILYLLVVLSLAIVKLFVEAHVCHWCWVSVVKRINEVDLRTYTFSLSVEVLLHVLFEEGLILFSSLFHILVNVHFLLFSFESQLFLKVFMLFPAASFFFGFVLLLFVDLFFSSLALLTCVVDRFVIL